MPTTELLRRLDDGHLRDWHLKSILVLQVTTWACWETSTKRVLACIIDQVQRNAMQCNTIQMQKFSDATIAIRDQTNVSTFSSTTALTALKAECVPETQSTVRLYMPSFGTAARTTSAMASRLCYKLKQRCISMSRGKGKEKTYGTRPNLTLPNEMPPASDMSKPPGRMTVQSRSSVCRWDSASYLACTTTRSARILFTVERLQGGKTYRMAPL